MNIDDLHTRVFRTVLAAADIEAMEEQGQLARASRPFVSGPLLGRYEEFFSAELRQRAEKMAYVYALFYCFENAIRDLVASRLEERKGETWWESVPENVRKRVEQKRAEAEANKWHQASVSTNIGYTLFGDLGSILIKEWSEFEELFPSQPWVKQRLDELERSRNIVAHGNLLIEAEIERIEQYLDDWIRQVP